MPIWQEPATSKGPLTLHTKYETFAPLSPTVSQIHTAAGPPCLILFLITSAAEIVRGEKVEDRIHDTPLPLLPMREKERNECRVWAPRRHGRIHRSINLARTLLSGSVDGMIRSAFATLSHIAAVFYIMVAMEHASVTRPSLFHHLVHASSCLIRGVPALRSQEWAPLAILKRQFYCQG